VNAKDFETEWDESITFPFIEDENANITGYGHQDKDEFADAVNRYDEICMGEPIDDVDKFSAHDVTHAWARQIDEERFQLCSPEHTGSFPITPLWGQR
jgi:hypothetical protein